MSIYLSNNEAAMNEAIIKGADYTGFRPNQFARNMLRAGLIAEGWLPKNREQRFVPIFSTEAEAQDWAGEMMGDITDEHVAALNIAGWRIVAVDPDPDTGEMHKWPFDSRQAGHPCPKWCEDLSATPMSNEHQRSDQ
jgi:hypothetical protein